MTLPENLAEAVSFVSEGVTMVQQQPEEDLSAAVVADVKVAMKRVAYAIRKMPKGVLPDEKTVKVLAQMNRQQRRAAISTMKHKKTK